MGNTPFRDLAEQRAEPRPRATRPRPRQCALLSQGPPTRPRHARPTVGASPRASIALYRCAKIRAFLNGRDYVLPEDVKDLAYPILRHRLKLSYEASAESISADEIITELLELIPQP